MTGLYPGCSLKGSSREYHESVTALAEKLGLDIPEIPDWNCCGATAAHNLDRDLALALPARILAGAARAGMEKILVPCAACYSRLSLTLHELREDETLRKKISAIIEADVSPETEVINILQWLDTEVVPRMREMKMTPFPYKVACYYGCLLVRPPKVLKFDRPEDPRSMDEIMTFLGAGPIEWAFKTECCGAGFSVSRTDVVARLSAAILEDARSKGAGIIIVACPMCHSNLDMRRGAIEKHARRSFSQPVIYITQAIGLSLGIPAKKLGLQRHFVPVRLGESNSGKDKGE